MSYIYLFGGHVVGVMEIIQHMVCDCIICTSVLPFCALAVELATHRLLLPPCCLSVAPRSRPGWTFSQRANILYVARGIHPICLGLSSWSTRTHTCTHTHAQFVRKVSLKSALAVTNGLGSEGKPFGRWMADRSKTLSSSPPWLSLG